MRWGVFIIFTLLTLAIDKNFVGALEVFGVKPAVFGCLAVFVALSAPRAAVLWACFGLGILLDLLDPPSPYGEFGRSVTLIGPYALGCVFGANLILPLRSMVFRRNPLTIGVLTCIFMLAVSVMYVAIGGLRLLYPEQLHLWTAGSAFDELGRRFLISLYSALLAIPLGWLLVRTTRLWNFQR